MSNFLDSYAPVFSASPVTNFSQPSGLAPFSLDAQNFNLTSQVQQLFSSPSLTASSDSVDKQSKKEKRRGFMKDIFSNFFGRNKDSQNFNQVETNKPNTKMIFIIVGGLAVLYFLFIHKKKSRR